jgi:hypothetical protein
MITVQVFWVVVGITALVFFLAGMITAATFIESDIKDEHE